MSDAKHKPTPWALTHGVFTTENGFFTMVEDEERCVAYVFDEKDSTHIVKCVNLHDELVEALKECAEAFNLHAEQYPHMVKGYTLDAFNAAYETLNKAGAL